MLVLFVTNSTSCEKGDCDGDGCSLGLDGIDGDGLGVKNGPGGDRIPNKNEKKKKIELNFYDLF